MRATVAGAPVSFGVFELTPKGADTVTPDEMVDVLVESGYAGIDLGPAGFLGEGPALARRLSNAGLELAGGWVQLPFSDDEAFHAALPELDLALRLFSAAAESGPSRLPLPTLADAGSPARRSAPGRGAALDVPSADAWRRLYANVARAAERVRHAGFEPTFHHHAGTYVESPDEIDRFLAHVDISLTLDTGHLFIAGGNPSDAVHRWGDRINHLHLKDVDLAELRRVLRAGGGMPEVWASRSFVPFGRGDIDLTAVMSALDEQGYDGWIVVEQDVLNGADVPLDQFLRDRSTDHRQNRDALLAWA
ncbi:sugar phosphate isomerase/epimerase family protein [Microbacterium sp. E-13]|uniref:sugar phosphate isomerase/epimerase family protein n=1 Tax=Microbacterium sp. E-13 TaxID=3404048 RepID=UPI003CF4A42F